MLAEHGAIRFPQAILSRRRDALRRFGGVMRPLVLVLLGLCAVYAVLGDRRDAAIVLVVVLTVGSTEAWAVREVAGARATLARFAASAGRVWRGGQVVVVPPGELQVDDKVILSAGSVVPADARLVEANALLIDESQVTGESQPVEYEAGPSASLKAGTRVLRGHGLAVVTSVEPDSGPVWIAERASRGEARATSADREARRLVRWLLLSAIVLSLLSAAFALLRGQGPREMVLRELTVVFAALPPEIPVLVAAGLGLAALTVARRGGRLRRPSAIEELATMTVICTDKTGTLTENRLTLTEAVPASLALESLNSGDPGLASLKRLALLASEPAIGGTVGLGGPVDEAIRRSCEWTWPEPVARFAFDSERRLASALVEAGDGLLLGVKGAPETVIVRCTGWRSLTGVEPIDSSLKSRAMLAADKVARTGVRVLAVASRSITGPVAGGPKVLERDLVFEGLLAFRDVLRVGVATAVRELDAFGIGISVVTGDHLATAVSIARDAGIEGPHLIAVQTRGWTDEALAAQIARGCVIARARPEDKLRMVRAAASRGEVVAMVGDGLNDVPALGAADLSVTTAEGSDAACRTADLILGDGSFGSLAAVAADARRSYANLKAGLSYWVTVKVALIVLTGTLALAGLPLAFGPPQIVVLEAVATIGTVCLFANRPAVAPSWGLRGHAGCSPSGPRALLEALPGALTLACVSGGVFVSVLPAAGAGGASTVALAGWLLGQASLGVVMASTRSLRPWAMLADRWPIVWLSVSAIGGATLLLVPSAARVAGYGPAPLSLAPAVLVVSVLAPWWLMALRAISARGESARCRAA
jgi:Ca2+-transporting ATPase